MNERIKELITEAFDTAEYPADQKYRIEPNKVFCQKFAELIVAEMLQTCEDHPGWSGRMIGEQIKQHFGVEE